MASWRRQIAPISSSGCAIVVEVSPWQIATTRGRCWRMADSICSGAKTVPHCASIAEIAPPQRWAI